MSKINFAIIHHANQYIITNGYENREGLDDVIGLHRKPGGYHEIFELHRAYGIPFHLHLSGTLLESILWHCPDFLAYLRDLRQLGLLDLIGSSYGQNIMRFFDYKHNFRQLNEELDLYREHLGVEPKNLKVFWPPERLWDTERLAPVLADSELLNGGYEYVLVDDRLYYPAGRGALSRKDLDRGRKGSLTDFCPCRIVGGKGLTALPISSLLRRSIPPRSKSNVKAFEELFRSLANENSQAGCPLIAIYGDDLEKSAGCCSWDKKGPAQYEIFLRWLVNNRWVNVVRLSQWIPAQRNVCQKLLEVGSYFEMSDRYGAGEDYEKWYHDPKWDRYRNYCAWSERRVTEKSSKGADPALLEIAWKHLLASSWETAWHTPVSGGYDRSGQEYDPSPWVKATASHSRHAAVMAEAAYWMKNKNAGAYAYLEDIDNDGDEELIFKNDLLFAVFVPSYGGRLVYLFDISGSQGKMVIGNPCDDWNWQEELNKYMRIPANHPGALTDVGHENDRYESSVTVSRGKTVEAVLLNKRKSSRAFGLKKTLRLGRGKNEIEVTYQLPPKLSNLSVECGFSPDYLHLLRFGRKSLKEHAVSHSRGYHSRGYSNNGVSVWVRLGDPAKTVFENESMSREFGHGYAIKVMALKSSYRIWIGTSCNPQ